MPGDKKWELWHFESGTDGELLARHWTAKHAKSHAMRHAGVKHWREVRLFDAKWSGAQNHHSYRILKSKNPAGFAAHAKSTGLDLWLASSKGQRKRRQKQSLQ